MPKIRDSVINYISKIKFRASFNAINPESIDAKQRQKNMMWAQKLLQDAMAEVQQNGKFTLPGQQDTSWMPDDFDDFEAVAKEKIKLQEEIRAELGCAEVFDQNEWKVTERRIDEDSFDLAFVAVECRSNKNTNKIEVNYVDPENMILPTFTGKTGDNIWIAGVVEQISLYQLYMEAGDQYTTDEYRLIAQFYQGRYNNLWDNSYVWDSDSSNNYSAWKSFTILRQRVYFYSVDVKKWRKNTIDGAETYRWEEWNKPPKETDYRGDNGEQIKNEYGAMDNQVVRQCSWIVGTQYSHDWGKLRNVSREQMDRRQNMLPIKVYRVSDQSRIERAIPFIDNMCLAWYRLQDRVARSMPAGIRVNLDAMEKLIVDGKEMTTKQILDLAIQTGIILFRVTDTMIPENNAQPLPPIEPHEGNVNGIFESYIGLMNEMKVAIRDVTGINELMDTTMIDPKAPVATSKLSYSAVLNSLSELVFCKQYLFEKTALDIAGKLQLMTLDGDIEMYSKQLGVIMSIPQTLSVAQLGITVDAVPTEQDRDMMKQMLVTALESTGTPLDFDDMYYINNLIDSTPSLKFAERLISIRIKRRRDETQQAKQADMQQQQQGLQDAEKQKQQAAYQALTTEYGFKKDFENFMTGEIQKREAAQTGLQNQRLAIKSDLKNEEVTHKSLVEQ